MAALRGCYPGLEAEVVKIDTDGDRDKTTSISGIEGSDFFTRDIDEAILKGDVDFAIHSAKDLPDKLPEGLTVVTITESIDPQDVLVSKHGLKLDELPYKAKIGTSSLRRKQGLKKYRSDLQIVDIRGNIEERLEKLDQDDLDAIVIAAAGLLRLGLEHRITERIPFEIITPHLLQGRLAIAARKNDEDIIRLCRKCLSQPNS